MQKALSHLKKSDPVLAALIRRVGPCRITYRDARFDALARSIVFQQLNGKAATAIYDRFESACGPAGVTPASILKLRLPRMRAAGLSARKSEYLKDLARRTQAGEIDFQALPAMDDQSVIHSLTLVKGVGEWTAQMFLIFALARPNVLPTADYGIRTAMRNLYALPDLPKPPEMERIAAPWRPWASVACWYLWRSVDGDAES